MKLLQHGEVRDIYLAFDKVEDDFVKFLESFHRGGQEKLLRLLRLVCNYEQFPVSAEKFRREFDEIFAIKSAQIRLFVLKDKETNPKEDLILIYFFRKKSQKLPKHIVEKIKAKAKEFKLWKQSQ